MGNPWLTGFPWAGTPANYPLPSGPWGGTPVLVTPGYTYFTPSPLYAPSAQELNYMFNQRDKAIQYNAAAVGNYHLVAIESAGDEFHGGVGNLYFGTQGWDTAAMLSPANAKAVELLALPTAPASGDILVVDFASSLSVTSAAAGSVQAQVLLQYDQGGNAGTGTLVVAPNAYAYRFFPASAGAQQDVTPISLRTIIPITANGAASIWLNASSSNVSTAGIGMQYGWELTVLHYSPNP